MLLIPKLRLGYQNIPKVATTSMFGWLYQVHEQVPTNVYLEGDLKRKFFLQQFKCDSKDEIMRAESTYLRVAFTRDPVRRFLSMYGNRVVAKRDLGPDRPNEQLVLDAGLPFNPQLNELVDALDDYCAVSKNFLHHTRPQMDFLGLDLSIYDQLLDISQIDQMLELIRIHWRQQGLDEILSTAEEKLPRLQTGGPKIGLDSLSRRSFDRLLEFFQNDYESIPTLDQASIKAQFLSENGGTSLYSFDFSQKSWAEEKNQRSNWKWWDKIN